MRFDKKENYGRRELFHQLNWELKLKELGEQIIPIFSQGSQLMFLKSSLDNSELELGNNKKLPPILK